MTRHRTAAALGWLPALFVGLIGAVSTPASASDDNGYGFFRTVEGVVRLTTFDKAEPIEVEPNYPVLTGDRIWVTPGARVEMMLPDRTVIRADGGTDVYLDSLALSADAEATATVVNLLSGELQVRVDSYLDGLEPVRIDTANASVYLQSAGSYRLYADDSGLSQVVVREGFAEVQTESGSTVVRAGEESIIEGTYAPRVSVRLASGLDGLEAWAAELDGYSRPGESAGYVDESLAYAAAPLDRHGSWVSVSGSWAWRPRVYGHWRPYTLGWWVYTPSGLTWVSADPWGWLTHHYGAWNYVPAYGWLWYPGAVYSPAWVYWYWGPTHVAWVPVGYYSHYYWPRYGGFGFHFGLYGYAGGSWDYFANWTFCPVRYFGRRHYRAYWRSGVEVARYGRHRAVPRGLVTTDTRALHPGHWGKPTDTADALRRAIHRRDLALGRDLPDVTSFVARRPELTSDVRRAVFRDGVDSGRTNLRSGVSSRPDRASGLGPAAPWRTERPISEGRDQSIHGSRTRDAAVSRGARIEQLRGGSRSTTAWSKPPSTGSVPPRPGSDSLRRLEDLRGDKALPQRPLPPPGRLAVPRVFPGDSKSGFVGESPGRTPLVRRLLEGVLSRGGAGAGSPTPSTRPPSSSGPDRRPSASVKGRTPERPSARPSPPPSSRPSARPSKPPERSRPSASSSPSRSSGSRARAVQRSRGRRGGG